MNQQEWDDLYQFLLDELRRIELTAVAFEVDAAATARIIESRTSLTVSPHGSGQQISRRRSRNQPQLIPQSSPNDSDDEGAFSRAPTSNEAFQIAIDVLRTRIIEFPAVLHALQRALGTGLNNIEWKPDIEEGGVAANSGTISGLMLSELLGQQGEVVERFRNIEVLMRQAQS